MTHRLVDEKDIERSLLWLNNYWNKPVHPDYYSAGTIDEAVSVLNRHGEGAKIIAGGVDIVSLMKNRVLSPGVLVNIKNIPEMRYITESDGSLTIGALALINDLERSDLIKNKYPILFDAARSIASPQVRNMATVGGNLCQEVRCWYYRRSPVTGITFDCRRKKDDGKCYATDGENQYHAIMGKTRCFAVCPSDMAIALAAMDAGINTVGTAGGRTIPLAEFYTNLGNVLTPDEVLTGVTVPGFKPGLKQRFIKFRMRKTIDFAIVSVAAAITLDNGTVTDARIVLGGAAPVPYRALEAEKALIGEKITESLARKAAKTSVSAAKPLSKNAYKVPVIEALVERALLE